MTKKFLLLALTLMLAACARQAHGPSTNVVPIPPPPPRGEPDMFVGLSSAPLRAMLGNPAFVRKDGATEMWRYDTRNCHAYFFLYGTGTAQAVRHVETLPQGRGRAADSACLDALPKTRSPFPQ